MQLTFTEIEFKQACHEGNITLDLNEEAFERCGGKVKKKTTHILLGRELLNAQSADPTQLGFPLTAQHIQGYKTTRHL
jgi:hypothetical protein